MYRLYMAIVLPRGISQKTARCFLKHVRSQKIRFGGCGWILSHFLHVTQKQIFGNKQQQRILPVFCLVFGGTKNGQPWCQTPRPTNFGSKDLVHRNSVIALFPKRPAPLSLVSGILHVGPTKSLTLSRVFPKFCLVQIFETGGISAMSFSRVFQKFASRDLVVASWVAAVGDKVDPK